MSDLIIRVLQHYDIHQPDSIVSLDAGRGFSGSTLWKVSHQGQEFCLKRWPAGKPKQRARQLISQVLPELVGHGIPLACPLVSGKSQRFVVEANSYWDLSGWVPGNPVVEHAVNATQLKNAMRWLASYHQFVKAMHQEKGLSTSLSYRAEFAAQLQQGLLQQLRAYDYVDLQPQLVSQILDNAQDALPALTGALQRASRQQYLLTPVISDIWSDHVFFEQDEVSGVIDFGAMKIDLPHLDIARLLGCYQTHNESALETGLACYREFQQFSDQARRLVDLYDQAYVVLAGVQWLVWLGPERRVFPDMNQVNRRLKRIVQRES